MSAFAVILAASAATDNSAKPYVPLFLAFALLVTSLAILFVDRVFPVFAVWVAAEGIAYPFLRFPLNHDVGTFDRVVLLSLGLALLMRRRSSMARASRRTMVALGAFVLFFGATMVFRVIHPLPLAPGTPPESSIQPELEWVENFLLPFIVFAIAAQTVTLARWRSLATMLTILGVSLALIVFVVNSGLGISLAGLSGLAGAGIQFTVLGLSGALRATGPYASPNSYGMIMIVCIVATLYLAQTGAPRWWIWMALSLEIASLFPGLTRTVWAAALVAIFVAAGLRRRFTSRVASVALLCVVIAAAVYAVAGSSASLEARLATGGTTGAQQDLYTRFAAWQQAPLIFAKWPLFGAGMEEYGNAQALVTPTFYNGVPAAYSAHNVEIDLLGEAGVVGLVLFCALVYVIVAMIRRWRRLCETDEEIIFAATVIGGLVAYALLSQDFVELYDQPAGLFVALLLGALAGRLNSKALLSRKPRRSKEMFALSGSSDGGLAAVRS